MWLTGSEEEIVNRFWEETGATEPFPRNLERYIALTLPLTLVKVPCLQLEDVHCWLRGRGVASRLDTANRRLRGCLIAHKGAGLIFVDGSDAECEVQFTIAHEVGHFLLDYIHPRGNALRAFGNSLSEVVDGDRPPTQSERVTSAITGIPLMIQVNLLERHPGGDATSGVWQAECRADRVALSLLAPPGVVLSRLARPFSADFRERHQALVIQLSAEFGLPEWASRDYARALLEMIDQGPSWVKALRRV
jgi:hypothetical protein